MAKKIKYPVGIQTFREIIEEKLFYVDKTELIYELVDSCKYVFLSRPRRFGKSLLMSTLSSYFRGEKELFKGLAIYDLETEWETYPVFRFDLSGNNFNSPQRLVNHITQYLSEIEHQYDLSSEGDVPVRFRQLIVQAYRKYGKRVVILIDEYDKPMLDCLRDTELHEKIKAELRGFYSVIKASDEFIKFAMITGITRFSKVSIFSGFNNLEDISLNPDYNDICGISGTEFLRDFKESIRNFAVANDISEEATWGEFKLMYDGYRFALPGENIYNPFSVLKAFKYKKLSDYWYESGSPSYLIGLIERNPYHLNGLDGAERNENQLVSVATITSDIVSLLYQSGYLTIKSYDSNNRMYSLGFPNYEVKRSFWSSLYNHFISISGSDSQFSVHEFVRDLNEGRPDDFMHRMQALFADRNSEQEIKKEIHFQNMMTIATKMMGFEVQTEVHTSAGRCDMRILTVSYIYIFEYKVDGSAEEALTQIKEKNYALPFVADRRKIYLIGADFSTKTRTLSSWIIETLSR